MYIFLKLNKIIIVIVVIIIFNLMLLFFCTKWQPIACLKENYLTCAVMPVSLSILSIEFAAQGIALLGIEHLLFTRKKTDIIMLNLFNF